MLKANELFGTSHFTINSCLKCFTPVNTPYSRQHHLWFLMRLKARLWGIVMHLFNGL